MSKKSFNASGVKTAKFGNNNLEVVFVDSVGRKQTVNLSPDARQHLMQALLARPEMPEGSEDPYAHERFLNVQAMGKASTPDGRDGLQFVVGQNMSVFLTFPESGKKALQEIAASYGDLSGIKIEDKNSAH